MNQQNGRKRRGPLARVLRAFGWLALVLIAIPLVLTPLYSFIDPVSVPMLERYLTGRPVTRIWRPIDRLSDRLKAAVVMSEDGQFCRHWGVELGALKEEAENLLKGKNFRGASTISMQVARNLFLGTWQSGARKLIEIPLAFYVDLVLSKRRLMEIYLNIAEWGPNGEFGIEAGARSAFGVDADALSWERAALLTMALPNPLQRKPARPTAHLRRVAAIIEARARQYGPRADCLSNSGRLRLE